MGNRNNKTTENKPIGIGFTNQNKSYGQTVFSRPPRPGGAPKSEEANRHADIHSSSAPQSLDTSELSSDEDGIKVSNVENVTNRDKAQHLQLLPSKPDQEDDEKILSEIVGKTRKLIMLCSSLKKYLALPDPIYNDCMKEVKSCYCEWCDTRNRIERTPRIQRLLFKKQPKFMQIFFEIRKLDYYFEFDVPVYEKHDSTTLHYVFQNPRKAIELTLLIAEHITSLLDERSPQNNPLLTSDGYADIESIFNSATEHGSVNVKTDDNPKAVENPNSNRTPGKVVKRKISAKVPEKSRRLLYILSLMAGYTGSTKTYDLLKDIENLEKEISKIEKRERRTHTQDIRILCDCGLIRKDKGSHYSITEKGREDVNRFKSDDQNNNSSESTNIDWFTNKWYDNYPDEGAGRK